MERELRLREHIRGLLLDYCRAHITEDYVTFTQDAVQTLLSDRIALVPLEDPNSITLPVDPLDALRRGLDTSLIPEEKWKADVGALGHIRKSMNLGVTSLAVSKCWHEIDPFERTVESLLPMSPILSRQTLKQTPKFGESGAATSPDSLRSTLGAYTLVPVKVPDISTPPLPTLEEILDVQYKIEPNLHREAVTLIRSAHMNTNPVPDRINSSVVAFLRSESPPLHAVETVEVPIFPRSCWPGLKGDPSTSPTKIPRSMSDLCYLTQAVEIEEEELSTEHMKVVDGWSMSKFHWLLNRIIEQIGLGGTSSQADELFPHSPLVGPGDGLSILELESFKMGEIQIPRHSRIGHVDDGLPHLPRSLSSFLPQHQISLVGLEAPTEERKPQGCLENTTTASSVLGQPPSKFDIDNEGRSHTNEDDLEADLRVIWSKAECGEFEIILQDGIDKSKALLFEVPGLPPPTAHKSWEQLPKNLVCLVSSLGMVKGIRSLNLELSWVPFKYGSKVPTNEEVSRVSDGILDDLTILIGRGPGHAGEVRRLLSDLVSRVPPELVSDLTFVGYTHPEDSVVAEMLSNDRNRPHQLVLTREERHKISRIGADLSGQLAPDPLQHLTGLASANNTTPIFGGGGSLSEGFEPNSQTPQPDFAQSKYMGSKGYEGEGEEGFVPAPAKKRRIGDFSPIVDPCLEPPPLPPDRLHPTVPLPITVAASPRQAELPNDNVQLLPAPQNPCAPLITTSKLCDLVQPNLSGTVHQSVRSASGRGIESSLTSTTGRRRDFDEFLALRGVPHDEPPVVMITETAVDKSQAIEAPPVPQPVTTKVPLDLIDGNTIQVPAADSLPTSRHQYLASLDLLQKRALCGCLSDDLAAIDLIEREFLGGVDLILDQDTAILFLSISALPSECEGLIAGICNISWRYSHILVIFEAFLISQAFDGCEENLLVSFAFTEPILKSVKKLKRSLLIADGVGTKAEDCVVSWAFARSIEEAARLARVYGDMAENRDTTGGLLWQERRWLGERESEDSPLFEFEDESELAMAAGMNAFAACLILSQVSSDQFLNLTPQERTERFGQLLGNKRMGELNRVLEQSAAALSSLPSSDLRGSSSIRL